MLTYNQILKRIQQLCVHHAQVKSYKYARPTDFLTEKTTEFTAVFLQDNDGNYTDWAIGSECNFQLLFEAFDALVAGVVVDFSIRVPYLSDRCAVPLY